MIKFENLKKTYKSQNNEFIKALDGFSLDILDNEVFALAGVNGAGKTTALKALFNLIKLDEGKVEVSVQESNRPIIGFAPEIPDLPDCFSVKEVLAISCRLSGVKPVQDLIDKSLEIFDLTKLQNMMVSTLSKGNKQRLSLAAATVYKPSIVVFDEPTSGLDPLGRRLIKSAIKELKKEGHTVLFSTHMLADLPGLCDRMAIVHKGRIVFSGIVSDFCDSANLEILEKRFAEFVEQEQSIV